MFRTHIKRLVTRKYKRKTGLKGYVHDFSTDYNAIDVDNIKNIHKYLIKKNKIECYENVQIYKANIYYNINVF